MPQVEQRFTLGVAYPANTVDGHGEFMDPADVEHACWGYLAQGRQVGVQHTDGTVGHGTVVESYIWRGPDWTIDQQTIHAGDWLLGVVWDEPTWQRIKNGDLTGFSIQGLGSRIPNTEPQPEQQ